MLKKIEIELTKQNFHHDMQKVFASTIVRREKIWEQLKKIIAT